MGCTACETVISACEGHFPAQGNGLSSHQHLAQSRWQLLAISPRAQRSVAVRQLSMAAGTVARMRGTEPPLLAQYRHYQQKQQAKFVRQRMLRLRAACMSRANRVRSVAKAGYKAFRGWQRLSRRMVVERSLSLQQQMHWQTWLRRAFESFSKMAAAARTARDRALQMQRRRLAWVLSAFQAGARCCKALRECGRSTQTAFQNRRLRRSLSLWQFRSLTQVQQRLKELNVSSKLRARLQHQVFRKLHRFTLLRAKCRYLTTKLAQKSASRGLRSLGENVLASGRRRAISQVLQESMLRSTLQLWAALLRVQKQLAELPQEKLFHIRIIISDWWRGLDLSKILRWWQLAARLQVKEQQAFHLEAVLDSRCGRNVLEAWASAASQLRRQQDALKYRCQRALLQCLWTSWTRRVTAVRLMQLFRRQRRYVFASHVLQSWRRQVICQQHLGLFVRQRAMQLCRRSINGWRAQNLARRQELRLQSQVVLAWLEWAALRRQVRDEVAWQRWADGVADLFISRRLLRGLPTCFSSWCHSVRLERATRSRAATLQTDLNRRYLRFAFGTLRSIIALGRMQRFDANVCLKQLRTFFEHLRWVCRMSANTETLQSFSNGGRKALATLMKCECRDFDFAVRL